MSPRSIVDAHIHLYPESHIKTLAWAKDLPNGHPLNQQLSVSEYKKVASSSLDNLKGFIFLETDRITQPLPADWDPNSPNLTEPAEWKHVLDETSFLGRIATGQPVPGEGHETSDSKLLLAIIPWAPIVENPGIVAAYHKLSLARLKDPKIQALLKGYRYLFQDKPAQTMLSPDVIDSLAWLGANNLVFDLGVDARQGGLHQLREACEMLSRLTTTCTAQSTSPPKIIINHLCKPNLRIPAQAALSGHPDFTEWSNYIQSMASQPYTFMKLSGGWAELPPQDSNDLAPLDVMLIQIKPWTDVVFNAFGPQRIMFASDWPVCQVGGGGENSWARWKEFVEMILEDRQLSEDDRDWVWAKTAESAYGLN